MEDEVKKLKELGNEFMRSNPHPDFDKAIAAYTKALAIDKSCHTVLTNRSLAFFKLLKYDEALADAERAIEASPNWPKGYLRKCLALNALKRNRDAQQAAQQGFLLMHSTSFCREFVNQWLKACDEIYSEDKLGELLPRGPAQLYNVMLIVSKQNGGQVIPVGLKVVSDVYWKILFYCIASLASPELTPPNDVIKQYFVQILDEFKQIMTLFGHDTNHTIMKWASFLGETINDYQSLMQTKTCSVEATEHFVKFLNSNLHVTLYDIARPLLLLIITVISTQMYAFNSANTGHYSICHMMFMCLPLFDSAVLNGPEYINHHVNMLVGLIDSYNRTSTNLSHNQCSVLEGHCKKLESLLPQFASRYPTNYQQFREHYENVIGKAKTAMFSLNTGKTISFASLPSYSSDQAMQQMKVILQKPKEFLTICDAEEMIGLSDVFFDVNNKLEGKNALLAGEMLILSLLGVQIQQGIVSLNELLPTIRAFRHKILFSASHLKKTEFEKVLCNMIIRWKGLFSEFKVTAIRKGLRDAFLTTSAQFQTLKASGIVDKKIIKERIASLEKNHQNDVQLFLKRNGFQCWKKVALFPLLESIECVLLDNELIIEYFLIGKYDEADVKASYDLYILALKPDGTHQLSIVSQSDLTDAIKKWIEQWNVVTSMLHNGIHSDKGKQLLQEVGKKLSNVLFPPPIYQCIANPTVKHVYVCPEPHFSMIPLQLLPAENGLPLFQGRSVAYLESCRELLRFEIAAKEDILHASESSAKIQQNDTVSCSSCELKQPINCYVFTNPDFNHCLEMPEVASIWEQFSVLNPFRPETVPHCQPLEHSLEEALSLQNILGLCHPELDVHLFQGKEANLESVLSLKSPLLVHFSTHGFGSFRFQFDSPNLSQENSESGLALAGFNTYMSKKFDHIDPKAASGMLTSLAINGLDLSNTRLVFLSSCVSGIGATHLQESTNSIANAFRLAGARTVIATIWSIDDEATAEFVKYFYNKLCIPETRPSVALNAACEELSSNPTYSSWHYWAGFACHGDDLPVFNR